MKIHVYTFEGTSKKFNDNSDEREINLNIRIDFNEIKSKDIGVDHMTAFSKLLTSKSRTGNGRATTLYSFMIMNYFVYIITL